MELQSTSQRRSRRSSKQPARPVLGWTPLELVRVMSLGLVAAGPWYYAGAPWLSQYWMVWVSFALAVLMVCEIIRRGWLNGELSKLAMPWLSVVFLGLAGFGCIQAIPYFSVDSQGGWAPPSIAIQRWFLGIPDAKLDERFNTLANGPSTASPKSQNTWFQDAKLSLSVEPMHTRAAVGGLAMVSLMIWIGSTAFQTRRSQLALMIFMSIVGVAIGLIGLAHVLSWNRVNWLGLDSSNSFATFVSRNTAGGFLNVCLAGSIGFAAWAFSQPRDKEQRYSYGSESPALRLIHTFEDVFSQLTTMQISALLSTSFILIAVLCTGSRGASISAVVACLIALLVSQRDKKNKAGLWIFAFFVIAIGLTGIYFFELDDRITSRFSEFAKASSLELDIEAGRLYIWGVAWKAFLFFGSLGSGLGTFHFAHLPFQDPFCNLWFYHAESLYAQALVELGVFGFLGIATTIFLTVQAVRKLAKPSVAAKTSKGKEVVEQYHSIFLVGLTLAISQSVHSIFDFALIVPAVFLPAGLLIGMVLGAARNRTRAETRSIEINSGNLSFSSRGTQVPIIEGSPRFPNTPSVVQPSATPARSWSKDTGIMVVGSVGLLLFLWTSIKPIDAMCRVAAMNDWVQGQVKVSRVSRLGSPSAYLAGLWGTPDVSIYQVPDALRMLGESVIYEFRSQRLDKTETAANEPPSVAWEKTSPLVLRMAISEKESEAKAKGIDQETFLKSGDFDALIGGTQQLARWKKSLELIERAHLKSPLDWRLVWSRLLLDPTLEVSKWNGWFDRTSLVSRHKPDTLFQLGILAWQAAKDQKRVYPIWEFAMKLSPPLVPSTASIIAMTTSDKDVPVNIFPPRPDYLNEIVKKPFNSEQFPVTNEKLWNKLHDSALGMDTGNIQRYMWLAGAAAHFGDTEKEVEYLRELVDQTPMNRPYRMLLAERLGAIGQFDQALEHAEVCQKMAPDDPQVEASLKRLKTLAMESKTRESRDK